MGVWGDRILPHVLDKTCGSKQLEPLRARVCSGLEGTVVEIGFGSGRNLPHYPDAVTRVSAVEPVDEAWRMASRHLDRSTVPVVRAALDGQALPFEDASFDNAVSTWTLCTIPDAVLALRELRRVLKPGGRLHFLEHGLAPDANVQRMQHRMDPIQRRVFGGCHFSRPIPDMIASAGFTLVEVDEFYEPGGPRFASAVKLGRAAA